jgi:hypothetical protein
MKRLLIMVSIATLLAGAWPSHAQPQGPGGGGRRGMEQPMRPGQPTPPMPPPQRDFRGDAQDPRRGGQLTPEERRQLRRDIGDHGRDVYRDRRPPQR